MKKRILSLLVCISLFSSLTSQHEIHVTNYVDYDELKENRMLDIDLDVDYIKKALNSKSESITLPFLNSTHNFSVEEFSIHDGGGNPFPEIKTYKIYSKFDKTLTGRITTGPAGINVSYLSNGRLVRIYPDNYELNTKKVYTQEIGVAERMGHDETYCDMHSMPKTESIMPHPQREHFKELQKKNGSIRRVYRVALICTGEWSELNGGGARQLAISSLNDISAIYEKDMSFELTLASGSPLMRTNSSTDEFIPNSSIGRPSQAQSAIENEFNISRYDVGHVFHRSVSGDGFGSGGVAGLGVICNASRKASGWSSSFNVNNNSWIQLAAHEFGHMFNSPHTFNGIGGSCDTGNHPASTAYEIASGTTIMSYQGICDAEYNIPAQGMADNYFHVNSLNRMTDYAENFGICNENQWVVDNNNEPIAMANPCGAVYDMPRLTPFMLVGEATDADGDALTYNWEQYDEDGPGQRPTHGLIGSDAANSNTAPLYRSYPPNGDPTRTIPSLSNLANNISSDYEVLTRRSRNINFRFVVRDNNPNGGAVDWDQITIKTNAGKGPLTITSQQEGDTIQAGSTIAVDWDPNNSEDLCDKAVIKLSTDGGLSFPFTIASDIDYAAGTAQVIIPASFSNTELARIMIACDDYECFTFFDITNRNFTIESNCFAPASLLCDDSGGTFLFADPALDFDEDVIDGTTFNSLDGPLEALETMNVTVNGLNGCTSVNGVNNPFQEFKFSVTVPGTYQFSVGAGPSFPDENISAYSIFEKDGFNTINPCESFVASNATNSGGFSVSNQFSATLDACTEYVLAAMVTTNETNTLALLNIEGPGLAVLGQDSDDYALTFLAFDAATEEIVSVNEDADFVDLPAGEYFIKSAYFKTSGPTPPNNVDPNTFIGVTQSELLGGVDCIFPSANEREIIIEATCFVENITEISRTDCDPLTNTFDITLSFGVDMGPGTGQVTINGQTFDISGADATVTLTDIISNGEMIDLDFKFSDDKGCDRIYQDVFQASQNCCPIVIDLGSDRSLCTGEVEMLDGGTDGETYEWYRDGNLLAQTSQVIEVTNSGVYSVLVTNNTGCINEAAVNLSFESIPTASLSLSAIDACFGEIADIELFTNANEIEWLLDGSPIATNTVVYGVSEPGNYEVIVTSEFGCKDTADFVAVFKDAPEVNLGEDFLTCDGAIHTLDAQLVGAQYSYDWRRNFFPTGDDSQFLEVTTFGTYVVTVTDTDNNCESSDTINIDYEELPEFDFASDKNRCDGSTFVIEAEESAFTINWYFNDELIPGVNTVDFTASEDGEYVAAIEINEQCIETDTFVLTILDSPNLNLPEVVSACPGEDVILTVDDTNSTYEWSSENGGPISEQSNTLVVNTADTYYLYAFNNSTFCEKRDTVEVVFLNVPTLDLGPDIVACDNETVTLSSETNGFQVQWFFNDELIQGEINSSIEVTQAGEYRILIDQGSGCMSEDILSLTYTPSPTVDLGADRSACPGDIITINAGVTTNVYEWSSEEDGVLAETSNNLEVTKTGTYYVAASADGCTTLDTVVITFADLPMIDLGEDVSNCEGDLYTISIDSEGFDLEWSLNDQVITSANSDDLLAEESGTYIVKISAGASCSISDTIEISYNAFPVVHLGDDRSACPGDVIELTVDELGNTYVWSTLQNGQLPETGNVLSLTESGTYIVDVINPSDCSTSDTVTIDFTSLPNLNLGADITVCQGEDVVLVGTSDGFDVEWFLNDNLITGASEDNLAVVESGTYIMKVSSSVTCAISDTVEVSFIDAPVVDLGDDRSACPSDNVILDGGDASNSFVWSTESGLPIAETGNMLQVTESDTYYVEASNGSCSKRDTVTITFTELPMLDLGADINDVCEGADLELIANTNGFTTSWLLNDEVIVGEENETLSILESGTYIVVASASSTCSTSDTIDINLVPAPTLLTLDDQLGCEGTTITLTAGTDDEYTFVWSDDTGIIQEGGIASIDLTTSGSYTVEANDVNGCTTSQTVAIEFIAQPTVEIDETLSICDGEPTEIVSTSNVNIIDWYFEGNFVMTLNDEIFEASESGEYVAIVGAGTECESSDTIVVTSIDSPQFSIEGEQEVCTNDLPIMFNVDLESDETIQWFFNENEIVMATAETLSPDEEGEYSAVVTNSNNCEATEVLSLAIFENSSNTLLTVPDLCDGDAFTMEATTDGSTFEYRDGGGTVISTGEENLEITESGTYAFVSFNDIGCETISEFEVAFAELPEVDLGPAEQSACIGTDIVFDLENIAGATYEWSKDGSVITGEDSNVLTVSEDGVYSVLVTNSEGCEVSGESSIEFFESPELTTDTEASFCVGSSASLSITTNANIIRWILNGNEVANNITTFDVLTGGTYVVEVESDNGCVVSQEVEVTEAEAPIVSIDNIELCPGESQEINLDPGFADYMWDGISAVGSSATINFESFTEITTQTASVTVIDQTGCTTTEEFSITYFPPINALVAADRINSCLGDSEMLEAAGGLFYDWTDPTNTLSQTDIANPIATPDETTTYMVAISDNCPGNIANLSVEVIVNDLPEANAGVDTCAISGLEFTLNASGGTGYQWDNTDFIVGSSNVSNAIIEITDPTTFTVTVTDDNGCQNTDEVDICILDDPLEVIKAVTVITPNGDAANDMLEFNGLEAYPDNVLTVFNRWGNVIFQKRGYQNDALRWDGTRDGVELPADTYYYILEFSTFKIKKSITLLRN